MTRYIPCAASEEYLVGGGVVIGAAGSHDDVCLRIEFDEYWADLSKYVTFRDAAGENPVIIALLPEMVVPGTDNTYDVPTPAKAKAIEGRCSVTATGYRLINGTQEDSATVSVRTFFRVLPSDYVIYGDGSIDATIAQQLQAEIDEEKAHRLDARQAAKDSEAWAVGQIEGEDVPETADQYHNNAKYYAQQADDDASSASADALKAEGFAVGEQNGTPVISGTYYHNNAKYYKEQADTSASNAATSESNALGYKNDAGDSATAAAGSASDAKDYRDAAYGYMGNAAGSAADALASEGLAQGYATDAGSAKTAAETAQGKAEDAQAAAETAQGKAEDAQEAAETAQGLAESAQTAAETAQGKAEDWATLAESYAVGGTESRTGEDTDNAEYYADQAHAWATGGGGGETPGPENNASYWAYVANIARRSAQSYAVGGTGSRVGENTDNSKYYSQQAAASAGSLVPTFDDTETYAAGDLVLYDSAIYRFTAAHTGAWTGTDAVQTSIAGELAVKADKTALAIAQAQALAAYPTDTASGPIASFPDGAEGIPVKSMTVDIEPSQDLHGYDNPWPAGGGKNKVGSVASVGYNISAGGEDQPGTLASSSTDYYPVAASTQYTLSCNQAVNSLRLAEYDANKVFIVRDEASNTASITVTTQASTAFVRWCINKDNATAPTQADCDALQIQLELGSTATDFAPYSNICPISGWTGANIVQMGKNLIIDSIASANVNSSGKIVSSNDYDLFIAPIKSGVDYVVTDGEPAGTLYAEFENVPSMGDIAPNGRVILPDSKTFSATMDGYVVFRTAHGYATPMIEVGTTATTYEAPITPTTYTVDWTDEGTVLGGTAEYIGGGKWRVTPDKLTATITDPNQFTDQTTYIRCDTYFDTRKQGTSWNVWSNIAEGGNTEATGAYVRWTSASTNRAIFYNVTLNAVRDAASNGGVQIVYELATPLTPFIVDGPDPVTLYGDNNIFADCGPVELNYRADTGLYIDKKLGA